MLRTTEVGEADRFCILLSALHGRIAVAAKGVRRPESKWVGAIQSFQHLRVDLAEHSSGYILRSAECIASFPRLRADVAKFVLAARGSELLLRLLHDADPEEGIFPLAREYFAACDEEATPLLFPTFLLTLFSRLGLLPSFDDAERIAAAFPHPPLQFVVST